MSVVVRLASTIPARKTSGRRTRSDPMTLGLRRFLACILRGRDLVAHAPHGDDRRRIAELPPELTHMDVDRARVSREGVTPDALEQLIPRQHETAMVEQLPQEIELLRSQLNLVLADAHFAPARVDFQVPVRDLL